jgi:hypothetical protein
MGKKIETEEFLQKYAEQNQAELTKELSPDIQKIIANVKAEAAKKNKKSRWLLVLKTCAAVVVVGILFNAMVFFSDMAPVRAYGRDVKRFVLTLLAPDRDKNTVSDGVNITDDNIAAVQKKVPYHIPVPSKLPQGYSFNRIDMTDNLDGTYDVTIIYRSASGAITYLVTNSDLFQKTKPSDGESPFKAQVIDGITVYSSSPTEEGEHIVCFFVNKKGLFCNIAGSISEQSLMEMIQSMNQ